MRWLRTLQLKLYLHQFFYCFVQQHDWIHHIIMRILSFVSSGKFFCSWADLILAFFARIGFSQLHTHPLSFICLRLEGFKFESATNFYYFIFTVVLTKPIIVLCVLRMFSRNIINICLYRMTISSILELLTLSIKRFIPFLL